MQQYQSNEFKEERKRVLGYTPQKELFHNFHLPYAKSLDDESAQQLSYIKNELGRSLALREISPGLGMFVSRLMT